MNEVEAVHQAEGGCPLRAILGEKRLIDLPNKEGDRKLPCARKPGIFDVVSDSCVLEYRWLAQHTRQEPISQPSLKRRRWGDHGG